MALTALKLAAVTTVTPSAKQKAKERGDDAQFVLEDITSKQVHREHSIEILSTL
jgi:hypothetical protein